MWKVDHNSREDRIVGRRLALVVVGLSLALCLSTRALAAQQYIVGIGVGPAAPTGDLSDIVKTGGGGSFFIGGMIRDGLMLKVDAGYWIFSSEELTLDGGQQVEVDGAVLPFRIGIRKYWGESKRFYTGPNLGGYIPGRDLDGLKSHFGFGPQIGVRFPVGDRGRSVDLVAEFHTIFIGDENPLTKQDRTFFEEDTVSFFTFGLTYVIGSIGN